MADEKADQVIRERLDALPSRQDKSRAAAAWLFFEAGEHPSVQRVRELTGLGSTSDIARDLRQFWQDIRSRVKSRIDAPDLPDAVVEKVSGFISDVWSLSLEKAAETFEQERRSIQSDLAKARTDILQSQADAQAHRDLSDHLQARLDAIQSQQEADAQRMGSLQAELQAEKDAAQQLREQHAQELAQRDAAMQSLRADMDKMLESQRQQIEAAAGEVRFAKLQIENARAEGRHWKSEFERERSESTVRLSILEQRLAAEREAAGAAALRAQEAESRVEQMRGQLAALRPLRKAHQRVR
jgi:hypothetical protein